MNGEGLTVRAVRIRLARWFWYRVAAPLRAAAQALEDWAVDDVMTVEGGFE
jgi:hypothetical protein